MNIQTGGDCPLFEYDPAQEALINPSHHRGSALPECCVLVFYRSVIENLLSEGCIIEVARLNSIMEPVRLYNLEMDNRNICVIGVTGCGGPLAGGIMEEVIARGCCKFMACGSAGALDSNILHNSIVIPTGAVRDEGTSFHYLPPSRTVMNDSGVIKTLENVLKRHKAAYSIGLNWTTDASYRETRAKIALRKAEGCLTVDMEHASMLAVAQFRKVIFGQYLLVGDDCGGAEWDPRQWNKQLSAYDKIFQLSVEAVLQL